jgi:hypothetical protein
MLNLPNTNLTPEQEQKYLMIIDIYKKMQEQLLQLQSEMKKIQKNIDEKNEKEKNKKYSSFYHKYY